MAFGKKSNEDVELDVPDIEEDAVAEDATDTSVSVAELDQWEQLDAQDWRADGPFDIDEVDLDADDVERIDFGGIIVTPFDGMKLQLQVDSESDAVQAILIMHEQSGLEVSLFAAPSVSSMIAEIRQQMIEATEAGGGEVRLAESPFGTEIRRVMPMLNPEGKQVYHISRTWFAQGPKWLLRGVLMGAAATEDGITEPVEVLFETFCNLVVRRGSAPMAPGQLIPLKMPAQAE